MGASNLMPGPEKICRVTCAAAVVVVASPVELSDVVSLEPDVVTAESVEAGADDDTVEPLLEHALSATMAMPVTNALETDIRGSVRIFMRRLYK